MSTTLARTTLAIYRDCMRAAEHLGGKSKKADAVKSSIRGEFRRNRDETDPEKIEELRQCAINGLANYLTIYSLGQLKKKPSVERSKLAQQKAIEAKLAEEKEQKDKEIQAKERNYIEAAKAAIAAKKQQQ